MNRGPAGQERSASTDQPHAPYGRQATLNAHVHPVTADRHLVTVAGDLDLYTARRLADALQPLLQREGQAVLAGLPGVTFLDSTRLTRLIAAGCVTVPDQRFRFRG